MLKTVTKLLMPGARRIFKRCNQWKVEHTAMALARRFRLLRHLPVPMHDSRFLYLDLRNPVCMPYLLLGDFPCEQYETEFARRVVRPGETVVDIGANVGWYASLLAQTVGSDGRVYAFEPNLRLVQLLNSLSRENPQLKVVHAGLGAENGKERFSIPENWISGSFGEVADAVEDYEVELFSLDSFLEKDGISDLTFIKCDAEGAELGIISGAKELLQRERPPIWMIEMSSEEAARFKYHPRRLVELFSEIAGDRYATLMIDQETGRLRPLEIPAEEPFWFNAVFVPEWLNDRVCTEESAVV